MTPTIPVFDIREFATDKIAFAEALGDGYQRFGFCGITGHEIPDDMIKAAFSASREFFGLPEETKKQYFIKGTGGARGYTPFGIERAKGMVAYDLKEFWHMGRDLAPGHPYEEIMQPNLIVKELPQFHEQLKALFCALDELGNRVLSALALYVGQDEHYFDDKVNFGNSILRPIHYPALEEAPPAGSVRAGAHEDINLITLLVGSEEPGLEVLSRQGDWIPVTVIEGTIIVNISDMLQRLTNHVLPSTTHRVVNPEGDACLNSRYSIPYFLHANPDFLIKTLSSCISEQRPDQYPEPILVNDYLNQRLREINLL